VFGNTQRRLTAQSLQQLQSGGADLPPITFAAEQSAITKAEAEIVVVNRAVEIQRERVTSFASLVSRDTDAFPSRNSELETQNLIQAHETAQLAQAQERQTLAQSELAFQRAKLTSAREARAFAAQQHRIELTRQILSARSQQQQAESERVRLIAQIAELNLQLAHMTAVRAPFAGTIKRIEWEDMTDEKLTVWVYLAVGSR
jgi:chromosome segregation ATPase